MIMVVPRKVTSDVQTAALPGVTQRIDAPDMMWGDGGRALLEGADALDKLGRRMQNTVEDQQEERNAARAVELETLARREAMDYQYNPQTGSLLQKGGLALGSKDRTAKYMEELTKKYTGMEGENPQVLNMLTKKLGSLNSDMLDVSTRHEFGEFQTYKSTQLKAREETNNSEAALNYGDEKVFAKSWEDNQKVLNARAAQEGWSPEQFKQERNTSYSKMRRDQITAMVSQNRPLDILKAQEVYNEANSRGQLTFDDAQGIKKLLDASVPGAMAQRAYGGFSTATTADKKQIIDFVIDEIEGGEKLADEPDGGIAKWGISSDVAGKKRSGLTADQVRALDRDGAVALYDKNYWQAIGADSLPENMRLIAYDTAVNMGPETATKLLKQANGDPKLMIELRYKEYQALVRKDRAKYEKYMPGWQNRLAKLEDQLSVTPDDGQIAAKASELDIQYPGAGDELLDLHKRMVEGKASAQRLAKTQFLDEVMPILYQNNGDWSQLSPQQKAKAIEIDAWKDITSFNGATNPQIGVLVANMTVDEILSTDFTQPNWRLNMSQNDYESLVKKKTDLQSKPSARGEFRTTRDIVSQGWKSMGKQTSDPDYGNFQAAIEDSFEAEIEVRGGKPLSSDEKRGIVAKMVMNASLGDKWYSDKKRVYELEPDAQYNISGLDPMVATGAIDALMAYNAEPSQKNVAAFVKNPSDFIKVEGYDEGQVAGAVKSLMRAKAPVSPATVKSYLQRKYAQANNG